MPHISFEKQLLFMYLYITYMYILNIMFLIKVLYPFSKTFFLSNSSFTTKFRLK